MTSIGALATGRQPSGGDQATYRFRGIAVAGAGTVRLIEFAVID